MVTSITKALNTTFVQKFQVLAQDAGQGSSSGGKSLALSSSKVDLSTSLRFGAQTFATAIQGLNTVTSFINIGPSTLGQLRDLTTKLISLADRATKSSTGSSTRNQLNTEFQKLGNDFKEIVEDAELGSREYLTVDGLSEIFAIAGLSKEDSEAIANVFKEFVTSTDDDEFASEAIKGDRPVPIPAGAFNTATSDTVFVSRQISNSNITTGEISEGNSVYTTTTDVLNSHPNSSTNSVYVDNSGSVSTIEAGFPSTDFNNITLRAVDETTGYSLIETDDDILGYNADLVKQLYLVDNLGTVVQQITKNTGALQQTIGSADISSIRDDTDPTVIIQYVESGSFDHVIQSVVTGGAFGVDPTTYTTTELFRQPAGGSTYSGVKISNDGEYGIHLRDGDKPELFDLATTTIDPVLAAEGLVQEYEFVDSKHVVMIQGNGLGGDLVRAFISGDPAVVTLDPDTTPKSKLTAIEANTTPSGVAAIALHIEALSAVGAYSYDISLQSEAFLFGVAINGADTLNSVSMRVNDLGTVDLGFVGQLGNTFGTGDSQNELYEYKQNAQATSGLKLSTNSSEVDKIFDNNIRSRASAFKVLEDLSALREQIDGNIGALQNAQSVIADNIDVVRSIGFAFLNLSDQISSEDEADDVAFQIRKKVLSDTTSAQRAHTLENLDNIAAAALLLSEEDLS